MFIDQNGVSFFIDQNGGTVFIDQNGILLGGAAISSVVPLRFRLAKSAFVPTDLSGLVFWANATGNFQDVARTTAATANNDPVGSLTDHSTGGHNGSQSTSGSRPLLKTSIIGSRSIVRFDGSNDDIALSGVTLGASGTIFVVAKKSSTASAYILATDGASATDPGILSNAGSSFSWINNNGGSDTHAILDHGNAFHVICVKQTDASTLKLYIDGSLWLSATPNSAISGRTFLHLGTANGTASPYGGDVADVLIWNGNNLSATEQQQVEDYIVAQAGGGTAVYAGDSLTAGNGSTSGIGNDYPQQTHELIAVPWRRVNVGDPGIALGPHTGDGGHDMINLAPTVVDPLYSPYRAKNTLVVWAGTNDIYFGANGATAYSRLVTYCQARRTVGWKVIVCTALSRSDAGTPVGFNTDRATLNTSIVANWPTFADALADLAANANIGPNGAETNVTYFAGDNIHMNDTGYSVIASIVAPLIV